MRAVINVGLNLGIRLSKLSPYIALVGAFIFGSAVLLTQTVNAVESCYLASDSADRLTLVVDRMGAAHRLM